MDSAEKMFQAKSMKTEQLYIAGAQLSKDGKEVTTMNIFCHLDGQNVMLVVEPATNELHKIVFSSDSEFDAALRVFMDKGCLNLGNSGAKH